MLKVAYIRKKTSCWNLWMLRSIGVGKLLYLYSYKVELRFSWFMIRGGELFLVKYAFCAGWKDLMGCAGYKIDR